VSDRAIRRLSEILAHEFSDANLLKQALTHRSFGSSHNERLEFLGDAVLGLIISEFLYGRFPDASEGELSRLRSGLVKGKTLAELAREIRLGECLRLGQGELKSGGRRRDSILADAFEALIGALYTDANMEKVRDFIGRVYAQRLESLALDQAGKDAKTQLQELLQARKMALPEYQLLECSGAEHDQLFTVSCSIAPLKKAVTGQGGSRREAEQAAAAVAIAKMRGQS
jgi:ribonuclease-3